MSQLVRRYTDEIHHHFSYWATWLPTSRLRTGDVGPLRQRVFEPQLNLEDLGVRLDVLQHAEPMDLQHKTANGVELTFQTRAGSQVIPQVPRGTAGVAVEFSSSGGVAFAMRRGRDRRIRNLDEVNREMLRLIKEGELPRDYAVATHVVDADAVTVLISSTGGARFVASAAVDLAAGLLDLANVSAGLSLVSSSHVETEIVASAGATPLLKLSGFKRGGWFWGSPKVTSLGFDTDDDPGTLDELSPDELDG